MRSGAIRWVPCDELGFGVRAGQERITVRGCETCSRPVDVLFRLLLRSLFRTCPKGGIPRASGGIGSGGLRRFAVGRRGRLSTEEGFDFVRERRVDAQQVVFACGRLLPVAMDVERVLRHADGLQQHPREIGERLDALRIRGLR
jgi:hypothetical protein